MNSNISIQPDLILIVYLVIVEPVHVNGEWDVLEHDEGVRDGNAGEEEVDKLAEMEKAANVREFHSKMCNCFFNCVIILGPIIALILKL